MSVSMWGYVQVNTAHWEARGLKHPKSQITDSCEPPSSARSQTWVLWKSTDEPSVWPQSTVSVLTTATYRIHKLLQAIGFIHIDELKFFALSLFSSTNINIYGNYIMMCKSQRKHITLLYIKF